MCQKKCSSDGVVAKNVAEKSCRKSWQKCGSDGVVAGSLRPLVGRGCLGASPAGASQSPPLHHQLAPSRWVQDTYLQRQNIEGGQVLEIFLDDDGPFLIWRSKKGLEKNEAELDNKPDRWNSIRRKTQACMPYQW